jgi:hypothetical protein
MPIQTPKEPGQARNPINPIFRELPNPPFLAGLFLGPQQPPCLWESGNPAGFAGYPADIRILLTFRYLFAILTLLVRHSRAAGLWRFVFLRTVREARRGNLAERKHLIAVIW